MRLSISNLLGPLCTTYQFDDGSCIRRSSRESLSFEKSGQVVQIEFYSNGARQYTYVLPTQLSAADRAKLSEKLIEYCARKKYKLAIDGSS